MRLTLCAVGRLRQSPARELVDDYVTRFNRIGRAIGLGPLQESEVEDRKGGGPAAEAVLLRRAIPRDGSIWVLDERGKMLSSPQFARALAQHREQSAHLAFVIGGADGLSPELRADAAFQLSLGPMVWPHLLVRVLIAEQLYRAASILTGAPYHRA